MITKTLVPLAVGAMPFKQQTSRVNYEPSSFDTEPKEAPEYQEINPPISGVAGKNAIEKTNNFGQAGEIYRGYDESTKQELIKNLLSEFSFSYSCQYRYETVFVKGRLVVCFIN